MKDATIMLRVTTEQKVAIKKNGTKRRDDHYRIYAV